MSAENVSEGSAAPISGNEKGAGMTVSHLILIDWLSEVPYGYLKPLYFSILKNQIVQLSKAFRASAIGRWRPTRGQLDSCRMPIQPENTAKDILLKRQSFTPRIVVRKNLTLLLC